MVDVVVDDDDDVLLHVPPETPLFLVLVEVAAAFVKSDSRTQACEKGDWYFIVQRLKCVCKGICMIEAAAFYDVFVRCRR